MKVLIETRGGIVVAIYSDTLEIKIDIVDWDEANSKEEVDEFTSKIDELDYQIL